MKNTLLFFWGVVFSSISLVGCSMNTAVKQSEPSLISTIDFSRADYGVRPSNYERVVKDYFETVLVDPESAKFSGWTEPKQEVMIKDHLPVFGYSLCVNINAKNSYGGYTGNHLYWIFTKNNSVMRVQDTTKFPYRKIFIGHDITC
ncbi:hypothetical protein [Xenorhabdus griffiniae]|uniref:Lipoprotein n=1 Tax=Xenorhabdus griffiniae TaxID=351672 RepID=A0ABY9XFP0_9GAMM|nr:hypothetical protein [Xenorhabdus griffiniae]MBD1229394.1 hypothetical protein [Xenorhabdus griffiniae]MBE8589130.1 hypothetical protein [Xenorhabdus griffiniae]WMV71652.1 hypothetical protein QL128_16140 [Xenorhabdus griffiniae]WNH01329.1 hypothetical protein QL112_016145 [Xenorhabdus griffiniae]